MEPKNNVDEDLRLRLEQVIEKSNVQTKILRKILNQLNKENEKSEKGTKGAGRKKS